MLDAVLSPDWQYRFYSFNHDWGPDEQMASMRNGCGDSYFILFNQHRAILKGYAHESAAARWVMDHNEPLPGMFSGVPQEFAPFFEEAAFSIQETTFCFWRRYINDRWNCGRPPEPARQDTTGATGLLAILEGDPNFYVKWARDYYEKPVDLASAHRIYRHEALSEELVHVLNPELTLDELREDINEIGYPQSP